MARRPTIGLLAVALTIVTFFYLMSSPHGQVTVEKIKNTWTPPNPDIPREESSRFVEKTEADSLLDSANSKSSSGPDLQSLIHGKPIMAKMTNQTARAQLGNAGWRVFHTILAQYPEQPTPEARDTLWNYLHLFSRVYPCRECAEHFQQLLKDYPPQLSSRKVAVMWGCDAHNKVNKRLGKPIFDCAYIDDKYDCGCEEETEKTENEVPPVKGG